MSAPRPERRGVTATLPLTLVLTLSMGSLGCGSDASPPEIPEGCNTYGWAPGVADLSSFPTSDFLVADESRPTGYQMSLPEGADLTPFGPLAPLFDEHIVDLDGVGVQGEMWLTCGDRTRHLRPGDRFELARDVPHAERYGTEGATYWVARRNA